MTALTREHVERLLAGATPGPWRVEQDTTLVWGKCNPEDRSTCGMGYPVAEARITNEGKWAKGPSYDEGEANAHLISAAPDLARELLAAWDREAKLREPLGDGWKRVTAVSDIPLDQLLDGEEPPARQWRHMAVRLDDDMFYTVAFGDTP